MQTQMQVQSMDNLIESIRMERRKDEFLFEKEIFTIQNSEYKYQSELE